MIKSPRQITLVTITLMGLSIPCAHATVQSPQERQLTQAATAQRFCGDLNSPEINAILKNQADQYARRLTPASAALIAKMKQRPSFQASLPSMDKPKPRESIEQQINMCLAILPTIAIDPSTFVDEDSPEQLFLHALEVGTAQEVAALLNQNPALVRINQAGKAGILAQAVRRRDTDMITAVISAWNRSAPPSADGKNTSQTQLATLATDALGAAATTANPDALRLLLDAGANVKDPQTTKNLLFSMAIYTRHIKNLDRETEQRNRTMVVKILLKEGLSPLPVSKIHLGSTDMEVPLENAAYFGDTEMVQALLQAGADSQVNATAAYHRTALYRAAGRRNPDMVALLLSAKASALIAEESGQLPLHQAAMTGDLATAKLLLAAGAPPASPDKEGMQAIHKAIINGHSQMIELLISVGVDPSATDFNNRSTLGWAIQINRLPIVDLLLKAGAKYDGATLHQAIGVGSMELTRRQINEPGVKLNAFDENGYTPLQIAAGKGSIAIYELLLSNGADRLGLGKFGNEPIHNAAMSGQVAMLEHLIKAGANVNAIDGYGNSPAHYARGRPQAMQVLQNAQIK